MLKPLLRHIRNLFNFSHSEAKGFLVMSLLLGAFAIAFLIYDYIPSAGYTTYVQDKALLDSLVGQIEIQQKADSLTLRESSLVGSEREEKKRKQILFNFNPNSLPVDSLMILGIPSGIARRIENYRQKGGEFRKKEDLLKIYGFPDSLYKSMESYIIIPPPTSESERSSTGSPQPQPWEKKEEPEKISRFDINQADSLQLQKINGIGPVLSSRIIRFRSKLGGFVNLNQLYEVYGLDSAVVQRLMDMAYVQESFTPGQILLNSANQDELAEHPYLSPQQARLIFQYRTEHGPFRKISDLRKIHTFGPDLINKIAPYIRLE